MEPSVELEERREQVKRLARSLRDVLAYKMDWPPPLSILEKAEQALKDTPE